MRDLIQTAALTAVSVLMTTMALGQLAAPNVPQLGQSAVRQHGVLLLRNGQVLSGEIAKFDERYSIVVDRGEIRLHQRDVECVCRDLEEAYQQKRFQAREDCAQDRLELAQWCQSNGLLAHAVEELKVAIALNATHPLIPLVDRKIRMALEQQQMPTGHAMVAHDSNDPSVDELDRMVRGMPGGAVEMFAQSIQPMLANTCTVSGCHGPNADNDLRLLRVPAGRPPSRRLTQRNLHAVVKLINWDDPANSPLLTAPIKPHGTSRTAIFTDRQVDQYQHLVQWVHLVVSGKKVEREKSRNVLAAKHEEGKLPTSAVAPASHEVPIDQPHFGRPRNVEVVPATGELPGESMPLGQGSLRDDTMSRDAFSSWGGNSAGTWATLGEGMPVNASQSHRTPSNQEPATNTLRDAEAQRLPGQRLEAGPSPAGESHVQRGAKRTEFAPIDAFDAQIFNRRFAPRSPAAPSEGQ